MEAPGSGWGGSGGQRGASEARAGLHTPAQLPAAAPPSRSRALGSAVPSGLQLGSGTCQSGRRPGLPRLTHSSANFYSISQKEKQQTKSAAQSPPPFAFRAALPRAAPHPARARPAETSRPRPPPPCTALTCRTRTAPRAWRGWRRSAGSGPRCPRCWCSGCPCWAEAPTSGPSGPSGSDRGRGGGGRRRREEAEAARWGRAGLGRAPGSATRRAGCCSGALCRPSVSLSVCPSGGATPPCWARPATSASSHPRPPRRACQSGRTSVTRRPRLGWNSTRQRPGPARCHLGGGWGCLDSGTTASLRTAVGW